MTAPLVLCDVRDGVATLTLNDPERLNPLTLPLLQACLAAIEQIRADRAVRALVIKAAGRAFCAGADLRDFVPAAGADAAARRAPEVVDELLAEGGNPLVLALRALPVPVLAVVHGIAAGGGVGLALAADIVVAGRSAAFLLPFVPSLALLPDMASTWVMQRAIGTARTTALALLGERLGAEQAAAWGLIWACVDDDLLSQTADAIAERLAGLPPNAVVDVRALLRSDAPRDLAGQLEHERARQVALMAAPDFAEGLQAFLHKRKPRFSGR